MDRVLSATISLAALAFGCIALVLAIFLPVIAPYLVHFEGEQLALYVQFGRLALLSNFLFVFGSTLGQQLITMQRYWVYGITPILYTACTILGTIYLTPSYGPFGPMLGTVGGALLYALLRAADVYRSGSRLMPVLWHPDLAHMGVLMLPRMLSLGALQMQLLFFDSFASGLGKGAITINSAARNFQSVVVGVVGIALAQAIYSPLSQAAAKSDVPLYVYYLRKALLYTVALTVPGAVLLVIFAPIAARLVSLQSVMAPFQFALLIYAFSIPLESMNHLLLRGYYALKDTLFAAIFSVAGGLVAVTAAWLLLPVMSVYALAAGFTAGQLTQALGLGIFLPTRLRQLKGIKAVPVDGSVEGE